MTRAVVLFCPPILACAPSALESLPREAVATDVRVEVAGDAGRTLIQLGTATGDIVAGTPVLATTTTVARTEGGRPPLEISASSSSWDLKAHTARFEGNVVVTRGDVRMTCSVLDVTYATAETIDRVVATGSVSVDRLARHAEAERAELVGRTGQITLTGHPRLSEGASALVGDRITLWLDDERATCDGGPSGACRLVVAGSALGQ